MVFFITTESDIYDKFRNMMKDIMSYIAVNFNNYQMLQKLIESTKKHKQRCLKLKMQKWTNKNLNKQKQTIQTKTKQM